METGDDCAALKMGFVGSSMFLVKRSHLSYMSIMTLPKYSFVIHFISSCQISQGAVCAVSILVLRPALLEFLIYSEYEGRTGYGSADGDATPTIHSLDPMLFPKCLSHSTKG